MIGSPSQARRGKARRSRSKIADETGRPAAAPARIGRTEADRRRLGPVQPERLAETGMGVGRLHLGQVLAAGEGGDADRAVQSGRAAPAVRSAPPAPPVWARRRERPGPARLFLQQTLGRRIQPDDAGPPGGRKGERAGSASGLAVAG